MSWCVTAADKIPASYLPGLHGKDSASQSLCSHYEQLNSGGGLLLLGHSQNDLMIKPAWSDSVNTQVGHSHVTLKLSDF
jgi:hypothetical protein